MALVLSVPALASAVVAISIVPDLSVVALLALEPKASSTTALVVAGVMALVLSVPALASAVVAISIVPAVVVVAAGTGLGAF